MGEAYRTSEHRMRAAVQDMVTALDAHGDKFNRPEAIAVLGAVVGAFALVWGGEPEVVDGVVTGAREWVEAEHARRAAAAKPGRPAHVQEWLETLGPWHHDENWKSLDTPAIRAAVPTVREVYRHDCVGGNLHIVVDDYNVEDGSLATCPCWIEEGNFPEAQRRAERACLAALLPLNPRGAGQRHPAGRVTPRPPWTAAEVDRAAAMWSDGADADAIAAALGKSASAVIGRLHRHRASGDDAASRHPVVKWTPARDDRLLALWGTNASVESIAKAMGTTRRACTGRIDVLRPRCFWPPRRPMGGPGCWTWTDADDATIAVMRAEGATAAAIGAALGCTAEAVSGRMGKLRRQGIDVTLRQRERPARRRGRMVDESRYHEPPAVTVLSQELMREAQARHPGIDLAADPEWRKSVWRAAKRLLLRREDEVAALVAAAPTRGAAE